MDEQAKHASLAIEAVSEALCNWVVNDLAELNPQIPQRYGSSWREAWRAHTDSQIKLLAQAVAVRRGALFADSVHWTHQAFRARQVEEADLRDHLRSLRDVLKAELPPGVGPFAVDCVEQGLTQLPQQRSDSEVHAQLDPQHHASALKYLEAVLEGDRGLAEGLILEAVDSGVSVQQVYATVLQPAQAELGRMWHAGEISIADEHFGSATTQTVMSLLRPRFPKPAPRGRTVVATSPAGELHDIGLRMVADFFEMDGWTVIYLGANTPHPDVLELLQRKQAHLLALAVGTAYALRQAGELIEVVRADPASARTRIIVGGPPFAAIDDLWEEIGADGCAASAARAVALGNTLLSAEP